MKFTIWTLDNVLADDAWRLQFINPKAALRERRIAYDAMSIGDDPITVADFESCRDQGFVPVFIVDRSELLRRHVAVWILDNLGVVLPELFMRRAGDERPRIDVMIDALHEARDRLGIGHGDIAGLFTDDPTIAARLAAEFDIPTTTIISKNDGSAELRAAVDAQ